MRRSTRQLYLYKQLETCKPAISNPTSGSVLIGDYRLGPAHFPGQGNSNPLFIPILGPNQSASSFLPYLGSQPISQLSSSPPLFKSVDELLFSPPRFPTNQRALLIPPGPQPISELLYSRFYGSLPIW